MFESPLPLSFLFKIRSFRALPLTLTITGNETQKRLSSLAVLHTQTSNTSFRAVGHFATALVLVVAAAEKKKKKKEKKKKKKEKRRRRRRCARNKCCKVDFVATKLPPVLQPRM